MTGKKGLKYNIKQKEEKIKLYTHCNTSYACTGTGVQKRDSEEIDH